MLAFIKDKEEVWKYLPEKQDVKLLPRQYIADIIYNVLGDEFQTWLKEKIDQRNKELLSKTNSIIQMDAKVAEAFKNSTYVTSKFSKNLLSWIIF